MEQIKRYFLYTGIFSVLLLSVQPATGQGNAIDVNGEIDEILVTSKRPGPPLWQIKNGDNIVWLFGVLDAAAKEFDWDDSSIRDILADSGTYISRPALRISTRNPFKLPGILRRFNRFKRLPNQQYLEDVLPSDLYQRFLAVKEVYLPDDDKILRLKPRFAARILYQRALDENELQIISSDLSKELSKIAKRKKVALESLTAHLPADKVLDSLEEQIYEPNLNCLTATLDSIENDLENIKTRALKWSNGDASGFRILDYPDVQGACRTESIDANLENLNSENDWLYTVEQSLENSRISFASLSIREIARPEGLLDQLRKKGYQISIK